VALAIARNGTPSSARATAIVSRDGAATAMSPHIRCCGQLLRVTPDGASCHAHRLWPFHRKSKAGRKPGRSEGYGDVLSYCLTICRKRSVAWRLVARL
jgi:hypothetical protein